MSRVATSKPRSLCVACRLNFTPLDARLCVPCERSAEAKVEQLTHLIQDYERKYDKAFVRLDNIVYAECGCKVNECKGHTSEMKVMKPASGVFMCNEPGGSGSGTIELTEEDFIDETLEAIRDGIDDMNDVPGPSGFNKSR